MANVKGSAFTSRVLWVTLHHGDEGLAKLRDSLAPMTRQIVDGFVDKSHWYPFAAFIDLNLTIDRVFGDGDLKLVRLMGRYGADANLTTIYRLFFMFHTVKWVMDRAPRLWALHYDSGKLIINSKPGNEVELRIVRFDEPHKAHCLSVQGWVERSVELSGGKNVQVVEQQCRTDHPDAEDCVFVGRWD